MGESNVAVDERRALIGRHIEDAQVNKFDAIPILILPAIGDTYDYY